MTLLRKVRAFLQVRLLNVGHLCCIDRLKTALSTKKEVADGTGTSQKEGQFVGCHLPVVVPAPAARDSHILIVVVLLLLS